jgi:hypothetical protein
MFTGLKTHLGFGPPGDVLRNENAPYTVVEELKGYEVREYPESKWISTKGVNEAKNNKMFWRLFGYIDGKNGRGEKISMTVPVMTSNEKKEDESMESNMCFFIPNKFQADPPAPNDSDVEVITRPPLLVYTKQMSGFPNFKAEAEVFKAELEAAGVQDADFSMYFSAGYDSPFKLLNRRNEVMFKKIQK